MTKRQAANLLSFLGIALLLGVLIYTLINLPILGVILLGIAGIICLGFASDLYSDLKREGK